MAYLQEDGVRAGLYLDVDGEPREIVRYVREEDRQWLADVINEWIATGNSMD